MMSQYKDDFNSGQPPQRPSPSGSGDETNIAVAIVLTFVTCGIYGLIWQSKQMSSLNDFLGRNEYSFATWLLLSIVTCGLYAIYYEYKMAQGIVETQEMYNVRADQNLPILCIVLAVVGLWIVSMAIQQSEINKLYHA